MNEGWEQLVGQVIDGRFPLQRYLGRGQGSAVFLTQCAEPASQNVAIKLVQVDPQDVEAQLSRWKRAAELSHPHLVRLFQTGRWQSGGAVLLYVVMEYAEEVLVDVVRERPLTAVEAREMLDAVVDALAYVHGQHLAQGRLKPSNIMAVGDQLKISSDGICGMGEPCRNPSAYDAPETTGGGISPVGDIWSLGMTLVEALTQRLPAHHEPERTERLLPGGSPDIFADIVRQCLQTYPQRRGTIADIATLLHRTSAPPGGQNAVRRREAFTRWRTIAPAATLGIALAAILAGPRLLHRPALSSSSEQRKDQPEQAKLEKKLSQPEMEHSADRTIGKEASSSGATAAAPIPSPAAKPGADSAPGQVLHQVLPNVPQKARDTIEGRVKVSVRVRVDPAGHVVGAALDSPGPSTYFAELTLRAAQHWTFQPPRVQGKDMSSVWILRFEYTNSATKVFTVRVARN